MTEAPPGQPHTQTLPRKPDVRAHAPLSRRAAGIAAAVILVVGGVWRAVLAFELPAVSRDGVVFIQYARALGEHGPAFLRDPSAQQHPLFPILLLAGQRLAAAAGAPDTPILWQTVGQVICWIAGMAVVVLCGAIATRLTVELALPLDRRVAALGAMALAALLDFNQWLSADVMSDQVHLALYLGAVLLALRLASVARAAACGMLTGLAFLTRQEGFLPLIAALFAMLLMMQRVGWRAATARSAALVVGFVLLAGPYWATVGRFSTKKDPAEWFGGERASWPAPDGSSLAYGGAPSLAKLELLDLPWYDLLPNVLYTILRAGRVVIPLLALPPLLSLRRRLLEPPLAVVMTCIGGHLAMVTLLLDRYHYLHQRHTLVIVGLLTIFAALLVARLLDYARQHRSATLALVVAAVALGPLVPFALRVPNRQEAYLRTAAEWLTSQYHAARELVLLSGSSGRRIAFYADTRWELWSETPDDATGLAQQMRAIGRGVFAIETGDGFERRGNDALLHQMVSEGLPGVRVDALCSFPTLDGNALHLLRFAPAQD